MSHLTSVTHPSRQETLSQVDDDFPVASHVASDTGDALNFRGTVYLDARDPDIKPRSREKCRCDFAIENSDDKCACNLSVKRSV